MFVIGIKRKKIATSNLNKIQNLYDKKKIVDNSIINLDFLKKNKIIGKKYSQLKLLGSGDISIKLNIEADFVSKSAKNKLEKIGGTIKLNKK